MRRKHGGACTAAATKRGLYGSGLGTDLVRVASAELVGTFLLVLAGTAVATSAALERSIAGAPANSLAVGLAFGLVLVALVSALGHISGAHLNPAVTLGLAATKQFPWRFVPAYIGAQLVGAALAAGVVWGLYGDVARERVKLGATYPTQGVGDGQAFLMEMVITFLLVLIVIAVATDERVPASAAGPAVGFALAMEVLIGGPVTGGAVNPARALGPMLVAGDLTSAWVYVLGPVLGGVLAAVLYDRFLKKTEKPSGD